MNVWDTMQQKMPPELTGGFSHGVNLRPLTKETLFGREAPKVYAADLPPPFINRMGYVSLHNQNVEHSKKLRQGHPTSHSTMKITSQSTMRPFVEHGPAPPIRSLRHTTIREVANKVNHIHNDCILFVRTIYESHRMIGTNLLVEDDAGDCIMLSLYSFVAPNEDPNDAFPEGTYMALLAPYMKNSGDDPKLSLMLRCDNPQCVRIFPSRRSWLAAKRGKKLVDTDGLDPGQLRQEGNDAFGQGRFSSAARCYARALECTDITLEDKLACLGNLAEVRIRQELWEEAEIQAEAVLRLDPNHSKAKFRLATAQIHLNKFVDASTTIANEKGKAFRLLQLQIKDLMGEQCGRYNLKKMHQEARTRPGKSLATFHADYTSSKIGRGGDILKREGFSYRGTIAKEHIGRMTVISSSKALVFCQGDKTSLDYSIDPYTKLMLKGSSMALEDKLVRLLHQRPAITKTVYALSSGVSQTLDNDTKIDIKRIRGIVTSNIFGTNEADCVGQTWEHVQDRIRGENPGSDEALDDQWSSGSGLWINESLFNHSCVPNCTWRQIGDQMFIWTTKDIGAGEELTISYTNHEQSFSQREAKFKDWVVPGVGFQCQCDWCHLIRSSPRWREIEQRAHDAYKTAAQLVSTSSIKMAAAAEKAMSGSERKSILDRYSELPLQLQHNACADLWAMEGACEAARGNPQGALRAYERAAEIKYAVRGGFGVERAKDLWRIVGASMACNNSSKALEVLTEIHDDIFVHSSVSNVSEAFRGMTLHYALPWWHDGYDSHRQQILEGMIARVLTTRRR